MQPLIGITMAYDNYDLIRGGIEYSFIRREYGEQVKEAGGQPIFLDCSIDPITAAQLCDGIIISGGEDINPLFYGQKQQGTAIMEPTARTLWERQLINACDDYRVRILGVCYGEQLLNVHYGGTLYQDIADERGSTLSHGTVKNAAMNEVMFQKDFLGFLAGERVETAHRHHQAVRHLAPDFKAIANAEDGTIEAIAGRGHYGIQWHAESDGTAHRIYSAFVTKCRTQKEPRQAAQLTPIPLSTY